METTGTHMDTQRLSAPWKIDFLTREYWEDCGTKKLHKWTRVTCLWPVLGITNPVNIGADANEPCGVKCVKQRSTWCVAISYIKRCRRKPAD